MSRTQAEKATAFRALHVRAGAFVIPNPWDADSARVLTQLGFEALTTTSAGLAFSLGVPDGTGDVTRDMALENARAIAAATDLPVAADLENGYGDAPDDCALTIRLAGERAGLVGGSIEDATPDSRIYDLAHATERVAAAAEAARALPFPFMLVARAENFLHGKPDLDDTIRRLQAFEKAGADVLYAPGLASAEQIRTVCASVSKPVNVLMTTNPELQRMTVDDLARLGVKRISVGGALYRAALSALLRAGREMREQGTFHFAVDAVPHAEFQRQAREARRSRDQGRTTVENQQP